MTRTVIALTTFLRNRELWLPGEQKEVSSTVADELVKAGLVQELGGTEAAKVANVSSAPAHQPAKREKKPVASKRETK